MGSAAAVAVGWRHICCRHGCSENYDAKKHQCCNKTLPKGERGDYATTAQVMVGIPTIRKRMKSFPFMVAKHPLSLVDSA